MSCSYSRYRRLEIVMSAAISAFVTSSRKVDDLTPDVQADLTGETKDGDEVVSYGEDSGGYVAVGFRAKKSDGRYRCIWLLKVKFPMMPYLFRL